MPMVIGHLGSRGAAMLAKPAFEIALLSTLFGCGIDRTGWTQRRHADARLPCFKCLTDPS